jgi:putative hydrolase of the HAD superfamily
VEIRTVLFDADGVVQRPSAHRRAAWQALLGPERNVDEFVAALWEAESRALDGGVDFVSALSELVTQWRCQGGFQDALRAWTMIEPDERILQAVRALRRNGFRCCLATNQEPHRASYMSEHLGYCRLFDREFYSCRMGVAKPAPAYFRSIVDELHSSPGNVLFLDDNEANVAAAKQAGLNAEQFFVDLGAMKLWQTLRHFGIHVSDTEPV